MSGSSGASKSAAIRIRLLAPRGFRQGPAD
jgi:hypothetical protein